MAHRGNRVACPENTLASFRRAVEDGADILETDLYLSSDGAFVCIHDPTLDRTTDGKGPVEDRTLAELKALSASCGPEERSLPSGGPLTTLRPRNSVYRAPADSSKVTSRQAVNYAAFGH